MPHRRRGCSRCRSEHAAMPSYEPTIASSNHASMAQGSWTYRDAFRVRRPDRGIGIVEQASWPSLAGTTQRAERRAAAMCVGALGCLVSTAIDAKASTPTPASRTAWSASARRTASSSSTTARRPTRPPPRRRSPRSIASAGSAAGRRRPTISTNARRTSATSARPTRSARRANCSRGSCRRTCL